MCMSLDVHVFGHFTYVLVCKNVGQAYLSLFLRLATFYLDQCQMEIAQHYTLKSVYEKRQYIMGGKLFSSRVMFGPARL